jgi:hypothetical protein
MTTPAPTADDVRRLLGDLQPETIAEILKSGTTIAELEEVSVHLAGETDIAAELGRRLSGRAGWIYEMVSEETAPEED